MSSLEIVRISNPSCVKFQDLNYPVFSPCPSCGEYRGVSGESSCSMNVVLKADKVCLC
jgi:hypothetical protein